MPLIQIPHFGRLDPSSLAEYYDVEIDFNQRRIQLDLNFDNKLVEPESWDKIKNFIENIRIYDLNNKAYINNDYNDEEGDTVKTYLQHHLEELGKEELSGLIDMNSKSTGHEKQLLKKLQLVRVGIYPDSEDQFAVFDYSLGREITNYLVVIATDHNGNLEYITMES